MLAVWLFLASCGLGGWWVEYINDMPLPPPPPPLPAFVTASAMLLILAALGESSYWRSDAWSREPNVAVAKRSLIWLFVGGAAFTLALATAAYMELMGRAGFGTSPPLPPAMFAWVWAAPAYALFVTRRLLRNAEQFAMVPGRIEPTSYGRGRRRSQFIRPEDLRGARLLISELAGREDVCPRFEWRLRTRHMGECRVDGEKLFERVRDPDQYMAIVEAVIAANRQVGGSFQVLCA